MLADRFEYILMIAQEKNMTRAAKKLYISQPALTTHLNRLEAELGVKLFDRTKNPISLTPAGAFYIEKMKHITASEQMLRSDLRRIAAPNQTLLIGIGQARGNHWAAMFLPPFCEKYPDVNVQLVQASEQFMVEELKKGNIDIAIGSFQTALDGLTVVDLDREKFFFAAHKKYLLASRIPRDQISPVNPPVIAAEQLQRLPFIISPIGTGMRSDLDAILNANRIEMGRTITVSNLMNGLKLARMGLGVQLLSGAALQASLSFDQQFREPDIDYAEHFPELDFFALENMPSARSSLAVYSPYSVKVDLLKDLVEVVRTHVIPNCSFAIPAEGK